MVPSLKTRIFADGADLAAIARLSDDPSISGFTTNPTLMRAAGLSDYRAFARHLLDLVPDKPISLEVCADDPAEIARQAHLLAGWGSNVYVKVPITTTGGQPLSPVIHDLAHTGVKLNVTAVFTVEQCSQAIDALEGGASSFVSVFAGRIADAGIDPLPTVAASVKIAEERGDTKIIWASPREILNLVQADSVGCHVITMTPDLLGKVTLLGKDLEDFSRETVQMFYRDAAAARLVL